MWFVYLNLIVYLNVDRMNNIESVLVWLSQRARFPVHSLTLLMVFWIL